MSPNPQFKIQNCWYKKQQLHKPTQKSQYPKNSFLQQYMTNQLKSDPNPGHTKYNHNYAIPTNIPPSTNTIPYYESYPDHPYLSNKKTPTLKPLHPEQIKIEDEDQLPHLYSVKKTNQPQIEQLQNQNTLAKLLMFDSVDFANRQNNYNGKAASSHYYSINQGNSSNGEKSLNISNAVKYANSRYQTYNSTQTDPTMPTFSQPNKQQTKSTTYQPYNQISLNIPQSSPVYPNINNLQLFQTEYEYNYSGYPNPNPNQTSTYQPNKYQYQSNTNPNYPQIKTSLSANRNSPSPGSVQNKYQLDLSPSLNQQHPNNSSQSQQSQDVLYTFLIKLVDILSTKLRTQYRYPFETLYLNYKYKPFIPPIDPNYNQNPNTNTNINYPNTNTNQQNNNKTNKNNNILPTPINKNNNNYNLQQQGYSMQYTYAIPTDLNQINNNNNNPYLPNRQSTSINTYTYSHTSDDKSASLSSHDPNKKQDKYQHRIEQQDNNTSERDRSKQRQRSRDKQLQSIPSHALSSISSIDQQGNIHNISYPYNVSTSMNENNLYQYTHRKHIMAIQDHTVGTSNSYGYQTYPHHVNPSVRQSPKTKSNTTHTHTNTNKINTKSINLNKNPYNQTHPHPSTHQWGQQNSPTFHKIIEEEEQESNTNTNSNIGSSLYGATGGGVIGEFQFNSNMKVKSKGKNVNLKKKIQQAGYLYHEGSSGTTNQPRNNPQPQPQAQPKQSNTYQNSNNNRNHELSPSKPLTMQIVALSNSPQPFPKADNNLQLHLMQRQSTTTFIPPKQSNKNIPDPLNIDLLVDNLQQTSLEPVILPFNSTLQQPHQAHQTHVTRPQPQLMQYCPQNQPSSHHHPQQLITQQDQNREYNLEYNSRNNTNNNNSNSKSKSNSNSNNSSNKKNIGGNLKIISNNNSNSFNVNTFSNNNSSNNKNNSNIQSGRGRVDIQNNIQHVPNIDNISHHHQPSPNTQITMNSTTVPVPMPVSASPNPTNSDYIIQQQPIYIDVGQPVTYQKILMNNQNIGRSISSYIQNNIFENINTNKQQRFPVMANERRGDRPVTYSPTPVQYYHNLQMPVRPTSNLQNNMYFNQHPQGHVQENKMILLKHPHIVVPTSPRNGQKQVVNQIPIRFNSVSPPKNQRILSENKYPQIKIFQQQPPQPPLLLPQQQPQQPKQIFVTFNQDSSTRRPVSQPSPRPISTLTRVNTRQNIKPITMPAEQIKANFDQRKLVEVRADYYGQEARNVIINNKVVRQVSPVLKEVRSTPQLPRINFIPDQNNINSGRIRNISPTPPPNLFIQANNTQIPLHFSPTQPSPQKTEQISSVHSSLQSNKIPIQSRPQSNIISTTLKEVPFVKVQDVPSKTKINANTYSQGFILSQRQFIKNQDISSRTKINNNGLISSQKQLGMDQTIINKLDGQISKPGSKTNIPNGSNTYFDYYQSPKKQRLLSQQLQPQSQPVQQLKNSQYMMNIQPSPFIKPKQPFNFPTSPTASPKHILHNSPPPNMRNQPQSPHHIFSTKQQKSPQPLHPIYREYHDGASRPGSNRKKLNLVSKEQAFESKLSNQREVSDDY